MCMKVYRNLQGLEGGRDQRWCTYSSAILSRFRQWGWISPYTVYLLYGTIFCRLTSRRINKLQWDNLCKYVWLWHGFGMAFLLAAQSN